VFGSLSIYESGIISKPHYHTPMKKKEKSGNSLSKFNRRGTQCNIDFITSIYSAKIWNT
jgi:hypothetical protein